MWSSKILRLFVMLSIGCARRSRAFTASRASGICLRNFISDVILSRRRRISFYLEILRCAQDDDAYVLKKRNAGGPYQNPPALLFEEIEFKNRLASRLLIF